MQKADSYVSFFVERSTYINGVYNPNQVEKLVREEIKKFAGVDPLWVSPIVGRNDMVLASFMTANIPDEALFLLRLRYRERIYG